MLDLQIGGIEIMGLGIRAGYALRTAIGLLILFCLLGSCAQAVNLEWKKCLGGNSVDSAYSIQLDPSGNYMIASSTNSKDGDVKNNHGGLDCWMVKLDKNGTPSSKVCLGGTQNEMPFDIKRTSDGRFVFAGYTYSNDGDVAGNHGKSDFWVVKIDGNAKMIWQKCLGGSSDDEAHSIQQTAEGGYIVAGLTRSNNGNVSGNHGGLSDMWVVKLDASGNLVWQRCLGGSAEDVARSIQQTKDGGYIVAGYTRSKDGDVRSRNHGGGDWWVVKLDPSGNIVWERCLGGSRDDLAWSIQQTSDGGYVIAGNTQSSDGDVRSKYHGGADWWVVKLDGSGNIVWEWCLGGSLFDFAYSIQEHPYGGYTVAGYTESKDGDVKGLHGGSDFWVVRLDSSGKMLWQSCLGGSSLDEAHGIVTTPQGDHVVAGITNSNNGDVSCSGKALPNCWIAKLVDASCAIAAPDTVCRGSKGNTASVAYQVGASYEWSITNGNIRTDVHKPTIVFDVTGESSKRTVSLTLKVTKSRFSKTCSVSIPLNGAPNCTISAPDFVYSGSWGNSASTVYAVPSEASYRWTITNGEITSAGDTQSITFKAGKEGNTTLRVNVTKCGRSSSCTRSVSILPIPACAIAAPDSVCSESTDNTASTAISGDSYAWSIRNGNITTGNNTESIKFTVGRSGVTRLTVNVTKGRYWHECYKDVAIVPRPDCGWTSNSPVCNGTPVQFIGPAGMDSYQWVLGDGQASSASAPSHLYRAPGTYTVNLKVTKSGCSKSCSGTVVVNSQPDCSWSSDSPVCNGTPVQFSGPAGMDSYSWDFGDGALSSAQSVSHRYSAPGTYKVNLTVTNGGCTKTCPGSVEVRTPASCERAIYLEWQKCLGGTGEESAYSVLQTADGGYVVAGETESIDGDVRGNHGQLDFWIVKLDRSGKLAWKKCLGGTGDDTAYSIQQTADGGYVVAGETTSNDGNVNGNHGSYDYWVVLLDASGKIVWKRCLGGDGEDTAYSAQQTADGGYVVAGAAYSGSGNHGQQDCWVVKLNRSGRMEWQKCLGGSSWDGAGSIQQTADGGFVVAGYTDSNDGDVSGSHGKEDCWIVKLDPFGDLVWQRCLGGSSSDVAWSVKQTADGGYIIAGSTRSNDGDVRGNHGGEDFWLAKLNESGNLVWQRCLGGTGEDIAYSVRPTADGGYVVAGYTDSSNGDVSGKDGSGHWVVKLGATGNMVWEMCLGGGSWDNAYSIEQTGDGGYVVAGHEYSFDHSEFGSSDLWVAKLSNINCTITAPAEVSSGSAGNLASTAESGASYVWAITNGAITSSKYAQSISFTAGSAGITRLAVNVTKKGSWSECYKDIAIKPKPDSSLASDMAAGDSPDPQSSGMEYQKRDGGDGQAGTPVNKVRIYPG